MLCFPIHTVDRNYNSGPQVGRRREEMPMEATEGHTHARPSSLLALEQLCGSGIYMTRKLKTTQ